MPAGAEPSEESCCSRSNMSVSSISNATSSSMSDFFGLDSDATVTAEAVGFAVGFEFGFEALETDAARDAAEVVTDGLELDGV